MAVLSTCRGSEMPPPEISPDIDKVGVAIVKDVDALFIIGQLNVKDSMTRVHALKDFLETNEPKLDIIALQDIPKGFAWLTIGDYHVVYCSSRALTDDDKPNSAKAKPGTEKPATKQPGTEQPGTEQPGTEQPGTGKPKDSPPEWHIDRVAFLVRKSMPLSHWDVTFHTDEFNGLAATLRVETPSDTFRIHNLYNRNKELDMTKLFSYCQISHSDILLGDFNLHHPAWGGENVSVVEKSAKDLHDLSINYGMTCQTPRGAVTYSRSESEDKHSSTIDLTFAGVSIATRVNSCQVIDVKGFESDHRLVVTELQIALYTEVKSRYAWNLVNHEEFLAAVEDALSALGFPPLTSISDIDNYLERFIGAMTAALQRAVPIRQQGVQRRIPTRATQREIIAARAKAFVQLRSAPNPKWAGYWRRKRASQPTNRRKRRTIWRRFIAKDAERLVRGRNKIFQWSKLAKTWAQPKSSPRMPSLWDKEKQYTTDEDKASHFMDTMWGDFDEEAPRPLEMPKLSPNNASKLDISNELRKGEVKALIKQLPIGKAGGTDQVGNEAFKLGLPVVLPYVIHLFTACLKLDYHPRAFRHALTVVLPKPGKETYQRAKSWRPVALLSCVGKMLEKIVTNRFKELLMNHPDLVPLLQFGSPGKSTTNAVEYIINWVYRSWQRPFKGNAHHTSLLSLDISGAYDNVRRAEILQRLVDKGFPDWLVRFVWSFLSERSTELLIPGYCSKKYWVNIGIPQGSPLSPILFILFAAPILEIFNNYEPKVAEGKKLKKGKGAAACIVSVISYVDDTNFLVSSPSFELNCAILTELHERLMEWATPRGVKFGPDKYALMHFLQHKPRDGEENHMPDIKGLDRKELLKKKLRILGVIFDQYLRWDEHIKALRTKINKMLGYHTRISGSTWGPTLIRMRRLHISKMRSVIAYASPAWFIPQHTRHNLGLTKERLEMLEGVQNKCLVQVAGAYNKTDRMVLRKELNIESIEDYFGRIGATYRMKNIDSAYMVALAKAQQGEMRTRHQKRRKFQNPYVLLYGQAKQELEKVKAQYAKQNKDHELILQHVKQVGSIPEVAKLITIHNMEQCTIRCTEKWEAYVMMKSNEPGRRFIPAAYLEGWGPESLKYYRHLDRAESTMLMQCRSGAIGLNIWLKRMNSDKRTYSDSDQCPCNKGLHTVEHLFMHCPLLTKQRLKLAAEVKDFRFKNLLTSDAKAASRWAILNFGLDQFAWPREELMVTKSTTLQP